MDITNDLTIRIVGFHSHKDPGYSVDYFVLTTTDHGNHLVQVITQDYDAWDNYHPPPDCENDQLMSRTLDDNFIWMWTLENFSVSHDGGRSWYNWLPACKILVNCDYSSIDQVIFEDKIFGQMIVNPFRNPVGTTTHLFSTNGGITWKEKAE
jgi:hypothetical protein